MKANRKGFSLIEVAVTIVVLGVVIAGIVPVVGTAFRRAQLSSRKAIAHRLAQEKAESLQLTDLNSSLYDSLFYPNNNPVIAPVQFWELENEDYGSLSLNNNPDGPFAHFRRLTEGSWDLDQDGDIENTTVDPASLDRPGNLALIKVSAGWDFNNDGVDDRPMVVVSTLRSLVAAASLPPPSPCPGKKVYNFTQRLCYDTIQAAIDDASDNDVIGVMGKTADNSFDGVFKEEVNINNKSITLKGGYAADFDDANRDIVNQPTFIDGDNNYRPLTIDHNLTPIVVVTVDGFTIQGGSGGNYGGGVYALMTNSGSQLTLSNNIISNNNANYGGGVYASVYTSSSLTLSDNIISGNTAGQRGGGVMVMALASGPLTISNNTISGNTAISWGGGVYATVVTPSPFIFSDNTINANTTGDQGGGVWITTSGGLTTVKNNIITDNKATAASSYGGGVLAGVISSGSSLLIDSNTVTGNKANTLGGGGYLYQQDLGSLTLNNNTWINNLIDNLAIKGSPP